MDIKMNQKRKRLTWVLIVVIFMSMGSGIMGCARHSQTVKTETVDSSTGQTTVVTEKEVVHDADDGGSVLGSVVNVVGEVISFPFRILSRPSA